MNKDWMSYRAREAYRRGLKQYDEWTDEELIELFNDNKDKIPAVIYDYLKTVDPNFYKDVFLESPSGEFPEGTFSPAEYHHVANEYGRLDIRYFYEFTIPDFTNTDDALLELQEKYVRFTSYKQYMRGVKDYSDWTKAEIIKVLKNRVYPDKIIKLVNGSSIDFLRKELLAKGDKAVLGYRNEEHLYSDEYVVKEFGSVNIDNDYDDLKKARDAWRLEMKALKERKALEKADKAVADAGELCFLCKVAYFYGPYKKRGEAIAVKKADRFYFKSDEYHAKGWSMGENTLYFREVLETLKELPADFDYKAWQLAKD